MNNKEYKIARIIDRYSVAINGGKKDGIALGMKFEILGNTDDAVLDPDTKELLGYIVAPKAVVRVSEVYDKYSICINDDSFISSVMASRVQPNRTMSQAPLNVNSADIRPIAPVPSRNPISVGDSVSLFKS
ncbi:hypothetical protein BCY75_09580 [Latilactobacillus curvatus]|uniref:hypothetical protein n=1 Tax=Latilactobacillus curvatus TaxID=28038 RepID=UPI0008152B5C|nr:hypothetical protein [Latilactobacillus curvatus]ANY14228.1 hypothetical protein BCY75_09580 [Latilactobacillus curvatus]MDG2984320.1 hypothetical protein [Latilactobacillus curvatus]